LGVLSRPINRKVEKDTQKRRERRNLHVTMILKFALSKETLRLEPVRVEKRLTMIDTRDMSQLEQEYYPTRTK
jgi:hypothetical protein